MSFTSAMQRGSSGGPGGPASPAMGGGAPQPGSAPGGQMNPQAGIQQVHQAIMVILQKLQQVPGVNQQMFQQGQALMKQGTEMIAQSLPKRGG